MKLYVRQKVFSWGEKFSVYDESGREHYTVRGEVLTLGRRLHVYDEEGGELALIRQKVLSLMSRFFISVGGQEVAEIKQEFALAKPKYRVIGPEWKVQGDFMAHEYTFTGADSRELATVSKHWFTWGDTYEVDAFRSEDMLMALCVTIAIDASLFQYRA